MPGDLLDKCRNQSILRWKIALEFRIHRYLKENCELHSAECFPSSISHEMVSMKVRGNG